jgi:hypothetical protein
MTKDKLLDKLDELKGYDPEREHMIADSLLLEYINDDMVTRAFNNLKRWYA